MSKFLLLDQTVINLIVKSLLGANDVPDDLYTAGQTDWVDGSKSDALYISRLETTDVIPPILIEVQNKVNQDFISRLIRYCTFVYSHYKFLPIVFVIAINGFTSIALEADFDTSSIGFLLESSSKFWAKKFLLISAKSIKEQIKQEPMEPLAVLGYFMVSQETSLMALKGGVEKDKADAINEVFNETKKLFKEIVDSEDSNLVNIVRTAKAYARDGIEFINQQQKKFEKDILDPTIVHKSQGNENQQIMYSNKDMTFIESFKGKFGNWAKIFDAGKAKATSSLTSQKRP
ncbi:hypothetical protein G6F55_011725 [Rhizopus delemar]|nr:hypothetical protein G6F55_011725 [Rhizopus delemar]KAG1488802.1 hypothetical protein G6F54_011873 [Rhizopus delemar]KAG1511967.1 hypothetical protein G6F52_010524 [Rhizopus delemar]KAG1582733.1 hypothetical protein G6F48_008968 [Rhizopus delemar]